MRYILHPEADEELAQAVEYHANRDPELAVRFYREFERLASEICANPRLYRRFDPPARRALSTRFPYAILYLDYPDRIWIVAVMHLKRAPRYWKERLR